MKRLNTIKIVVLGLGIFITAIGSAFAQIKVVTTLPDLASITQYVGGDHVDVFSIAKGYQNPHFVDPKPSYIVKLSRADMFVTVGLDLELGWSPQLLQSSRNVQIQKGTSGYVDVSEGMPLLQVPTTTSREEGDIHIYGNPHYWLDPDRGKLIAKKIYTHLVQIDPKNQVDYARNLKAFDDKIDQKLVEWERKMAPYQNTEVIAYHNEWVYFEQRFGLNIVDFLEPKPGIPPSPSQLVKIINEVKSRNIPLLINSPYFSSSSPEVVARNTNIKIVPLSTMTGGYDEIKNYFDLFDYNINKIIDALTHSNASN
ncbi:MAG TPA: metal ABC transporter substrate-binding protein [Balneolaceae bacterium]|nr:metal ABC transporter substrate-binding protein [Balneolaceae bacterium]